MHLILEKSLHMRKNENLPIAMKKRRTFSKIKSLAIQRYEDTEYWQTNCTTFTECWNQTKQYRMFFPNSHKQMHARYFRTTKVLNVEATQHEHESSWQSPWTQHPTASTIRKDLFFWPIYDAFYSRKRS